MDLGDDSGLSSSPSTPGAEEDKDSAIQLFECGKGLQSNFSDTLNACLFDDEFPAKLYTHIRIKEGHDEELWESSSSAFDSISFADDCFGEQFKLIDELFGQARTNEEQTEKSIQIDDISEEILTEAAANCTTRHKDSTNAIEEATTADASPEDSERNLYKRQLRKRVRNVFADHDYIKSSDEPEVKNESEDDEIDDEIDEKSEDTEDDDKDFEPSCGAAKKPRRTVNSKSGKDNKYWERRQRNNLAAKRSREAKRAREIETAKKTAALEKENANLKNQVKKLKAAIKRAEKRLRTMV